MGKVLITVNLSFEHSIRSDIKDYLFFLDRNVKISETEFRGVLMIESMRDSLEVASALINSPIPESALATVTPIIVEGFYGNLNDIVNVVRGNINSGCSAFIIRCRLRGSAVSNNDCETALVSLVRGLGFRAMFRGDADCVVIVEGLGHWFGVYVGSRGFVRV
jgi:tRNA(Ser,Leu) C12 N-acetylase TAN1